MKKVFAFILAVTMLCVLASCGGKTPDETENGQNNSTAVGASGMKEKFDQMEYTLYTNIFFNDRGSDYEGQRLTKEGSFASIYDAYNSVTRYYVWGFADQTKCCDFQWEIVLPEGVTAPANGSYVTMTGDFTKSEEALDGYWFTNAELTELEPYKGESANYDYDLTTMSATLARVQIVNMEMFPDAFNGKTALIYGRAYSTASLQHPYYDESWYMDFINAEKSPAIGQYLILGGKLTASGETTVLDVTSYTETV